MVRRNAPTTAERTRAAQKRTKGIGVTVGERGGSTSGQRVTSGTGGGTDTGGGGGQNVGGTNTVSAKDKGSAGSIGGTVTPDDSALATSGNSAFARNVVPTARASAWANPEALIRNWFDFNRMPVDTGYEAMAQELQPSLGIQYMAANNKPGMGVGDTNNAGYLDFVNSMLTEGGQQGGRSLSANSVIEALLNPQNEGLKTHLADPTMKPEDQVTNMLSAMRYGTAPDLPTPMLTALLNQVNEAGKQYQSGMLSNPAGQDSTFYQYLAGLGLM